jgi:hypothetical protein
LLGESESSVVIALIALIDDEEDPIDDADLPRFSRFEEFL